MTTEQSEVLRCAAAWFDGRDGSSLELRNAVLALRVAGSVAAVHEAVRRAASEGIRASAADRERV